MQITSGVVQMSFKLRLRARSASLLMPSLRSAAAQDRALTIRIENAECKRCRWLRKPGAEHHNEFRKA